MTDWAFNEFTRATSDRARVDGQPLQGDNPYPFPISLKAYLNEQPGPVPPEPKPPMFVMFGERVPWRGLELCRAASNSVLRPERWPEGYEPAPGAKPWDDYWNHPHIGLAVFDGDGQVAYVTSDASAVLAAYRGKGIGAALQAEFMVAFPEMLFIALEMSLGHSVVPRPQSLGQGEAKGLPGVAFGGVRYTRAGRAMKVRSYHLLLDGGAVVDRDAQPADFNCDEWPT